MSVKGLNPDEVAFYHSLANNESAVQELGDDTLKKIAVEITGKLRKSTRSIGRYARAVAHDGGFWCVVRCSVTSIRLTKL